MVNSSFFADGGVYDTATVTSNDSTAPTAPSAAPSSLYAGGGVVGEGTVVSNETGPGPQSNTPSSFFTDGAVVTAATVVSSDTPGDNTASQAPSSFYPGGNIYDFLSQESVIVELLQALAAQTTTNASNSAASETSSAQQAANAAASATQAATVVQSAAGTATPLIDGTAAVGTSTKWAHEDHVHPTDTSRASVAALALKADKTYVDTQDAAQQGYTDTAVAPKADKTYVDTQDAAGKTYTDTQVAPKANTTYVDAQDATKVALAGNQNITGGYTITPKPLGNLTSFTPNPLLGNYQYGNNVGAITITAPSTDCAVDIVVTNSATAGGISFSGFRGGTTGEPLTTTNGSKFLISIRRIGGDSMYAIKALQ